jgi:hypothetical protein
MAESSRNRVIATVLAILLLLLLFLFVRCRNRQPAPTPPPVATAPATPTPQAAPPASPGMPPPAEVLTPATLVVPAQIGAGAVVAVAWTGPDNAGDYLTIVPAGSPDRVHENYVQTRTGNPLKLTAPIKAGAWEIRYVTAQSHTVLGRAPLEVLAAAATLEAPAETPIDTAFKVTWSGPDNAGDYVTLVPAGAADKASGNYAFTSKGSPLAILAPPNQGPAELRYVTGQDQKILARRPIQVIGLLATLDAPGEAVAGARIAVAWQGPGNDGDYLTVVPAGTPDGEYRNYSTVNKRSPTDVTVLMEPGAAELRYMTGRGAKVLGRRSITILAAQIELEAPASVGAGQPVSIIWKGPANSGDYLTIVAASAPDGNFGAYAMTNRSPLTVNAPKEAGPAEIRYISGQGGKVLARRAINVTP